MKLAAALLAATLVADEVPDAVPGVVVPPPGTAYCYPRLGYCVVSIPDYIEGAQCVAQAPAIIANLKKQIGTVQCARLEVTEPSRAPKS